MVELTLQGVPPNWLNRSMHHMVAYRAKKDWREAVMSAALRAYPYEKAKPDDHHRVSITFYYAGVPKDHEGAVACAKPLIDELQLERMIRMPHRGNLFIPAAGLIAKDDVEHIGKPEIDQVRVATRAEQRTVIRVEKA